MSVEGHIKDALKLIGALPVTGDAQDVVVAAKNQLRVALDELKKETESEANSDGR